LAILMAGITVSDAVIVLLIEHPMTFLSKDPTRKSDKEIHPVKICR
jgi:hypothetical protein